MNEQTLISLEARPSFSPHFKIELVQRGFGDDYYFRCEAGADSAVRHAARRAVEAGTQTSMNELQWTLEIDAAAALSILNDLNGSTFGLPCEPYRKMSIGRDGTTYILKVQQCFLSITCEWWSGASFDLDELSDFVNRLKKWPM